MPPKSRRQRLRQRLLRIPKSESELLELLQQCQNQQLLDQAALRMIEGVLSVSSKQVRDIMVPRAQMVVLDIESSLKDVIPIIVEHKHSRFPVIGKTKDSIKGIFHAKELIYHLDDLNQSIDRICYKASFVPESKRLDDLLQDFQKNHTHMVFVVDEYGGVSGLATIEDVLEEIVGDIEDEHFHEEAQIHSLGNKHYLVNGLTPVDDLALLLDTPLAHKELVTIGGLVAQHFGYIPKVGESIRLNNFDITIKQVDHRRIRLLEIRQCT